MNILIHARTLNLIQTDLIFPQEMDKRSHNAEGFLYKVFWREAGRPDAQWNHRDVQSPPFLVNDTGTYTPFEIKVQAVNTIGNGPAPEPEYGHSGEDSTSPELSFSPLRCDDAGNTQSEHPAQFRKICSTHLHFFK